MKGLLSAANLPHPLNHFFSDEDQKGTVFSKTAPNGLTLKVSLVAGKTTTLMNATIQEGDKLLDRVPQSLANQETANSIYVRFQQQSSVYAAV